MDRERLGVPIAVGNQKGGVGKTTNTVHIAAALGQRGYRSLIIDLDPAAGATKHLGIPVQSYAGTLELLTTSETPRTLAITDGTLYPVLYRLERAGFVTVRWETPPRGVPRKYYQLTTTGRDELARLTHEWTSFAASMSKLLGTGGGDRS